MENYKIIKNYLETFPNETTVETLISNIVKAEHTYEENVQKKIEKMKESIDIKLRYLRRIIFYFLYRYY